EAGESSTTRPTGGQGTDYGFVSTVDFEARRQGIRDVGYGIRDTWIDPAEAVPAIAPTTVEEVNTRVVGLAELHEHDIHLEDAQDGRSRISQRVNKNSQQVDLLMGDRMTLQETVWTVEEEAYAARVAWNHSIRLSQETYQELQTHHDHVDMRQEMSDIQKELISQREQLRRERQPGPDARFPDHQEIEKMESVFNISGCDVENQVKFATCTLLDATLTWWNSQIMTLGPDAYTMTWSVLKKKMTDKYCLLGEVNKLKIELWNLKVRDNNIPAYTNRFQELALICTKFVSNETEKVDKYLSGLPDNIYGNINSLKPKTLDEKIKLANDLMDQKLRTYAERKSDSKRNTDAISRNNQQPFKRQNVAKAYNLGSAEKKTYEENAPKDCPKLNNKNGGNGNAQGWVYVVGNAERNGNATGNPD
nr:reverse transcriptase domain-containing protein [Tanacetum cinerariifolium]